MARGRVEEVDGTGDIFVHDLGRVGGFVQYVGRTRTVPSTPASSTRSAPMPASSRQFWRTRIGIRRRRRTRRRGVMASQVRLPAPLLGRVRTLTSALSWSGIPFGGLFGAAMIALAGVTGALWITGGLYLIAIVLPALRPEWAQMSRAPADPEPDRTPAPP